LHFVYKLKTIYSSTPIFFTTYLAHI